MAIARLLLAIAPLSAAIARLLVAIARMSAAVARLSMAIARLSASIAGTPQTAGESLRIKLEALDERINDRVLLLVSRKAIELHKFVWATTLVEP
ncbi:MAG: hypothetical protein ABSB84_15190 [Verrucomicrobiota bacterium]|jgi:hypothetical protein